MNIDLKSCGYKADVALATCGTRYKSNVDLGHCADHRVKKTTDLGHCADHRVKKLPIWGTALTTQRRSLLTFRKWRKRPLKSLRITRLFICSK